ncbi:MAG: hypothetical protein RDV48_05645 [Candidatus Eremiobacteraeota bacterium]|nr:hypothetical protein [Candidatus Eremiobacteraeota bacterium]
MDRIGAGQQPVTGKTVMDRILEKHENPVVENWSLPVSKTKDHVAETMLREYRELKDEFIMTHKASNSIGELKIPVTINADGKTVAAAGKAIHIDDDPATPDEMVIKGETVEPYGQGGKSFNSYTITYREEGQTLVKKIHQAGHTEDACGDIGMGGGNEVAYLFDKSSQQLVYESMMGKEVIPQSFTRPAGKEDKGSPSSSGEGEAVSPRILKTDDRVFFGEFSLPINASSS